MVTGMTSACYFDGHSARMHRVGLTVDAGRLHIAAPGLACSVPLGSVRPAEPFARAPLVLRLDDGAWCELPADAAGRQLLDALGYRRGIVARWHARWPLALLALPLLLALLALLYVRVLPLAAAPVAATLPVTVDLDLGKAALGGFEGRGLMQPSRLPAERIAEVTALLPRVAPAHPRLPMRLLVRNTPRMEANAYALPDGAIIVSDDLVGLFLDGDGRLDATGKAELSALLAHEVGHLEHRHTVHAMAAASLGAVLSAALFGDVSVVAAALPARLARMRYSRDMEFEADAYAAQVLQRRHVPVRHFADALARLEAADGGAAVMPRWAEASMDYLSTHPDTRERIKRLQIP